MKRNMISRALPLALALVVTLTALQIRPAFAVTQSQIDALEGKRDEIQAQQEEMQGQIDELESQHANALEQKQALDYQNELSRQEIELIDEQIQLYTQLVEQKAREAEDAQTAADEQYEAYCKRIRAMEENGKYTYLSLLFSARSLSELLSNIDMIGEIMESDQRLYDNFIAARDNAEQAKADYQDTLTSLDEKQQELEAEKAELERQIAAATQMIIDLEADIEEYTRAYEEYEASVADIESQIQDLVEALERQQQANQASSIVGTGSYIWPLPGYSPGSAYGWRMHPILGVMKFHAGEDIGAPSGTPILAADSGTVILAGVNGGYGNCVMISHGNGRVTLYGHMSSIAVSNGASVTQGDVIGYVGSTGLSTGPHLHFEVRVDGATTDPKSYFNF